MKNHISILLLCLLPISLFAQGYVKDQRTAIEKEDEYNRYNASRISQVQILKALELAGVSVFNIPLNPFDTVYQFDIILTEYKGGEIVKRRSVGVMNDNTYRYYKDNDRFTNRVSVDYIDQLTFFAKDMDSLVYLKVETYSGALQGIKLDKHLTRYGQGYSWRSYSKVGWVLNQEIPVLVYASSWVDKVHNIERSCAAADLSSNILEAKALLENSPHYYVISYVVFEERKNKNN
ncbi:DUF5041 domain-containing protein [Sphingobacterium yanglingense]|uniref:Uncharacterized protein DUF5041 n=1 Tax=Sphingobacterium yanglingense TaxID=1437280 RepID=A0A4R6WDU3_9SPHI|nr:DUF5041 domain-containing protein [Sphingobacterium yanglingense]TDQ75999.1 uncharacterized protein DUF5041 [Sphingobacterium yanglingense]